MKQPKLTLVVTLTTLVALAGCAMRPMGPSVAVMPAAHKPFDVFQQEMSICKQYAEQQVSGQAEAANAQAVGTAFLSTGLGAALGGALGGGRAAGVGAASGAIAGTGAGAAESSQAAQPAIQQHYDTAFEQCMYAKGNQVPAFQPRLPPHSDRPRDDLDRWASPRILYSQTRRIE